MLFTIFHDLSRSFQVWFHDASRYGIHSKKNATRLTSSDSVSCLASALHASFGLWIDDIDMIHIDSLVLNIGILPEFTMTKEIKRTPSLMVCAGMTKGSG